jgi:predicted O-linked N-acetylglucosamine transferase (SPINDLY family)
MEEFYHLYNQAKREPKLHEQLINIGMQIYSNTQELRIKEDVLIKLIDVFPNEPGFYYYMGYSFKDINPAKAIPYHQKSYDINPDNVENLIDLCNLLHERGDSKTVIEMHKRIPFGEFLKDVRLLTLFVQCKYKEYYYKDCLKELLYIIKEKASSPSLTLHDKKWKQSTYLNAGHMYAILGDHEKSIQYTQKALELSKKFDLDLKNKTTALSNLLSLSDYTTVIQALHYKRALSINDYLPNVAKYMFTNTRRNSKIRIGYVSSDFTHHAISNFILPILKNHNREHFDIYLFSNRKDVWYRYYEYKESLHSIYELSIIEAADLINSHQIDILFDLNGHTENSRLDLFSLNPAPIQVSYLGFPNTSGLKAIKYRITDSVADNHETSQIYSEKLIRMPRCFLLYDSVNQDSPLLPRKTKDIIILGALNNEKKNSKAVLETWRKILQECPNTKLLIKLEAYDDIDERRVHYMNHLNVSKDRLLLMNKTTNEGYNKFFTMVDILLDTFPYSGTTTTCNALYNSVPVVTLYNKDCHAHNVSSSILKNACLDELVSYSVDEYICSVKQLVNNPKRIDQYKATISGRFIASMNPNQFMKDYENILKDLYIMTNRDNLDDIMEIII